MMSMTLARVAVAALALSLPATAALAQAGPKPTDLEGIWSFDGTCGSGYGMGLSADGSVWFDEWGAGLWVLDRDAILMILQESEMGVDTVTGVRSVILRIDAFHGDTFQATWLGEDITIDATRCN